ncbi:MAG: diguanylate cyclase [Candidatus Omnitrophica bacterium]|nr:diguanylate cyclase [Candidatus Omnitrophota bacterium]
MTSKILIVEDTQKDFDSFQQTLVNEKFIIVRSSDGKNLFELMEKENPDLIILDLILPETDGFELCKIIRSEERFLNIPILFFSSSLNMDNKLLGLQLGASDFLSKDCDSRELIIKIKNLLRTKRLYDDVVRLSVVDSLTHVYNRRYFQHRLRDEFERARRYDRDFCCLIIDVDKFKEVNDTLGHPIGDKALKSIADILRSNIRTADILCRYGGDEFGLLLPETNFQRAYVTAERVRSKVEKINLATEEKPVFISLSCGISSLVEGGALGMEELVTQADVALYKAKKAGRNQISFYGRK